jgi:hypothetical protein
MMKQLHRPFDEFIRYNSRGRLADLLHRADLIGTTSADTTDSYAHRVSWLSGRTSLSDRADNILLLEALIDFHPIVENINAGKSNEQQFGDIGCGRCSYENGKIVHNYEYLDANISQAMERQQAIFLLCGIMEYGLTFSDKGNYYESHSLAIIFLPLEDGSYGCYYINPYGKDIAPLKFYDRKLSKRRAKRLKFDAPIDILFIEQLVDYLNTFVSTEGVDVKIRHTRGPEHTYRGPCLQEGDNHGVCFAFPLVMWHHFSRCFDTTYIVDRKDVNLTTPSAKDMLRSGNLTGFVVSCFLRFYPDKMACMYLKMMSDEEEATKEAHTAVTKFIEDRGTYFIKRMMVALLGFMSQSSFRKIISG